MNFCATRCVLLHTFQLIVISSTTGYPAPVILWFHLLTAKQNITKVRVDYFHKEKIPLFLSHSLGHISELLAEYVEDCSFKSLSDYFFS